MVGIGGSWSEFIDYLFASLKSGDVKLLLEGESRSHGNSYSSKYTIVSDMNNAVLITYLSFE